MNFRNLFFVLFVLLTLPLFSKGAIKVLDSSIKWIDSVILGRTVENLDNTNESLAIILPANESIPTKRNLDINKSYPYIAKATEAETTETTTSDMSISNTEAFKEDDETINLAADTNNLTLITGASDKNITYMQILQKPNDLELNLKYAKQQGQIGNYKQTIATLERLVILYPDNADIKFYLLSILVKADTSDKTLGLIEEIKLIPDLSSEDLASVNEIEMDLKDRGEPKLWNFYADLGLGGLFNQNVNSVSKTRTKQSADEVVGFNTAMFDNVYSGSMGFTVIRSIGEASSMMINLSGTGSRQDMETTDNYESKGLTLAYDTSIGNHLVSPYFMLNKTTYETDATNIAFITGFGNYYTINDSHALNYGYSYSDSKNNQNTGHLTSDDTNTISQSITTGYDFTLSETISTSVGLGYGDSNAKDDTNDYENYDLDLRVNFSLPFAYLSIGNLTSLIDYSKIDTSINSQLLRSDLTNTSDIMITKAIGDFFPSIDPDRSYFITLSYEKVMSESNILNYDYIGDSFSIGFNKAIQFNK